MLRLADDDNARRTPAAPRPYRWLSVSVGLRRRRALG
jgi:hypothetical protein